MGVLPQEFENPEELNGAARLTYAIAISKEWPTPKVSGSDRSPTAAEGRRRTPGLQYVAGMWPTAQAHDSATPKTPEQIEEMRERTGAGVSNLNERASIWRTPNVQDGSGTGVEDPVKREEEGHSVKLKDQASVWQTPRASDGSNGGPNQTLNGKPALTMQARQMLGGNTLLDSSETSAQWPTPAAQRSGSNRGGAAGRVGPIRPSLDSLAKMWPTTTTSDAKMSGAQGYSSEGHHAGTTLTDAAIRNWSTPRANERQQQNSANAGEALSKQTKSWPTPATRDYKCPNGPEHLAKERGHHDQLPNAVILSGLPDPTATGAESIPGTSRLNPAFVEWLMGWPEDWTLPWSRKTSGQTVSVCSGTGSYQSRPQQQSDFSTQQSPAAPPEPDMAAAGKTRAELLKAIAESTPTGGGNNCRDGRYRFVVRKTALESGFKGSRFGIDLVVKNASKMPNLVELKTGKAIDVEPNGVGTDVGIVKMLEGKGNYEPPGFGDTKAFVLALYGAGEETTPADLVETLDELDRTNAAYGMVIDCSTRRKVSKENEVEMVLQDWFHVEQGPADIVENRKWLESLTTEAAPVARPAAPPPAGPPSFGPPGGAPGAKV